MQQDAERRPSQIRFLYATKATVPIETDKILFLDRLIDDARQGDVDVQLDLFLTGVSRDGVGQAKGLPEHTTADRIRESDLESALGEVSRRQGTVSYVCGPPAMTDAFVEFVASREGMDSARVLCEKWW